MKSNTFLLQLCLIIGICSCQSQTTNTKLNATLFEQGIQQKNIQLLDVRTAGEYKQVHLANSLQADWNNAQQFSDRIQHLDKSKPLYVYCLSGGRSAKAASFLRENGFQQVFELTGGINSWIANGKPVEGGAPTQQLSLGDYTTLIQSAPVVLIDFGATWCPPCKKMEPILSELIKEKGSLFKLAKVDGGNDYEVMKSQQVEALPVFILYKNGKETWRHQGVVSKEDLAAEITKAQ